MRLALSNFRNYADLEIEPAPGLNVFVGANAQGKSNLLEAIAMLGTGKSFRTSKDVDTVRDGADLAVIAGEARVRAGERESRVHGGEGTRRNAQDLHDQRRRRAVRELSRQAARGDVRSRRLQLAGGRADLAARVSQRRSVARRAAVLSRVGALPQSVAAEKRAAARRAAARSASCSRCTTASWSNRARRSCSLARISWRTLPRRRARAHARFTNGVEQFDVGYEPNVAFEEATAEAVGGRVRDAPGTRSGIGARAEGRGGRAASRRPQLDARRPSLAAYGSQGQQRTAVLALKVAEYVVHARAFARSAAAAARRRAFRTGRRTRGVPFLPASATTSKPS